MRHRQDLRERIGHALARDVRRRAVDGLVEALAVRVERGRRQHPDGAREHRGLVRQDVAEHVARDEHVELPRVPTSCIAQLSTRMCVSSTSGYSGAISSAMSRQSCVVSSTFILSTEHEALAALARGAEAHVQDAADLRLGVMHGVEADAAALLAGDPARLAEVDVARELAHDHDVEAGDDLGLERRGVREFREHRRRAAGSRRSRTPCAGPGSPSPAACRAGACRISGRRPSRRARRRRSWPAPASPRGAGRRRRRRPRRRRAPPRSRSSARRCEAPRGCAPPPAGSRGRSRRRAGARSSSRPHEKIHGSDCRRRSS